MALALCSNCERHIRDADAACPFCGSSSRAAVPVPLSRATRKALFVGASLLTFGAVETACAQATYGAAVEGDFVAPAVDAAAPRADAEPPAPMSCLEAEVPTLDGPAKPAHVDACSADDIERALAMCKSDPGAPGCVELREEKPDCARCILGPLPGEGRASAPLGAHPPGATLLDGRLCGASVIGRDDCQLPLVGYFACLEGACASCDRAGHDACYSRAIEACATPTSRACMAALDARPEWARDCTVRTSPGTYADALFRKSATWFCTSGP